MRNCFNPESASTDQASTDYSSAGYTTTNSTSAGQASAGCTPANQTSTTSRTRGRSCWRTGKSRKRSYTRRCTSGFIIIRGTLFSRFCRAIQCDYIPEYFFWEYEFSPDGRVTGDRVHYFFCRHPLWKNFKEIVCLSLFSHSLSIFFPLKIWQGHSGGLFLK
jgi:hypothetical protein